MKRANAGCRAMIGVASLTLACALHPMTLSAQEFSYAPPGELVSGSGQGRPDDKVYVPGMRFPIEEGPAFANSQVWGIGGSQGPAGGLCSDGNYMYPWHDNYCETRSWDMPLCPAGEGHQGQDIRAQDCQNNVHWVVAAAAGTVTNVGSYSVYITAADGTRFDYLHMGSVQVSVGDDVAQGERIGKVSNVFGGTPTSIHLHFNLRQNVAGLGNVYVPPYLSLVESYKVLMGIVDTHVEGFLDEASCEIVRGWAYDPEEPDETAEAVLYFDGDATSGQVGHPLLADFARDDLCGALGSCEHAFQTAPPLSLFDGESHQVFAYGSNGTSLRSPLGESPRTFQCSLTLPDGVLRQVADQASLNAWHFTPFWDEIQVSDGVLASFSEGSALDATPSLVASEEQPEALYLRDGTILREIGDEAIRRAWELSGPPELLSAAEWAGLTAGKPLRPRPMVLVRSDGTRYLLDDAIEGTGPGPQTGAGGSPNGGNGGASQGGSGEGGGAGDGDEGDDGCACNVGAPRNETRGAAWTWLAGLAIVSLTRSLPRRRIPRK